MDLIGTVKRIRRDLLRARDIDELARHCRQLSGPAKFALSADSVVVCTPIKNAAFWLPEYLDHHRKLGVAGFALCDTGSQDETISLLKGQPDVILLQTDLPMIYQNAMRGKLAKDYAGGSWALFADTDELFEFAGCENIPIEALTAHLAQQGFTGLPAVMLDLFPEGPLSLFDGADFARARADYRFYEWDAVSQCDYHDPQVPFTRLLEQNVTGRADTMIYWGGVRQRLFGERPCLSKTPLVKVEPGISPGAHPHCSSGKVRLADFHAVIKHYKFTNKVFERDRASVAGKVLSHGEDEMRLRAATKIGEVTMYSPAARLYGDAAQFLRQEGFAQPGHLAKRHADWFDQHSTKDI